MLKELRDFSKRCGLRQIRTPLRGAEADAAIEEGMKYFRATGKNFSVDQRTIRSTLRGLQAIQHMAGAPSDAAADAYHRIAAWGEARILASDASTHAYLFKHGASKDLHVHSEWMAAKEAVVFFNL